MDPHIKPFEVLKETEEEIIVRTGYEATVQKIHAFPMPGFLKFETDTLEKMEAFQFDDPWDDRRWFCGGDNQMAGIGNRFIRNLPPWIDTVKSLYADFPVYGEVCEGFETLWRIIGMENAFLWSSDYWRKYFKPGVKEIVDVCHAHDLPVIYHGCGNVKRIFEDFIEVGVDAYNPLEAKAGLDVVDLRRQYGHRIAFCGNMNVIEWANESKEMLKKIVLRKLNAAKGGGYIFQSDHTVSSDISGTNYDYVISLVRKYGQYPLQLGEYDIPDVI